MYDTALFVQDDVSLTKRLTLTAGYRIDNIAVHGESPAYEEYGYFNSAFQYVPLAAPGLHPRGRVDPDRRRLQRQPDRQRPVVLHQPLVQAHRELDHLRSPTTTSTASWARRTSAAWMRCTSTRSLSTKSTLYEAGYKQSMLRNTLYFSADLFQQLKYGTADNRRQVPDQGQRP